MTASEIDHDDGYDGPAELVTDTATIAVQVRLRGQFEPITGSYHWYGRVAASDQVAQLIGTGGRKVRLRTPHGEAETSLADVDPWGRPRVEGFGAAPFDVVTDV
jgi:hypothetical protein